VDRVTGDAESDVELRLVVTGRVQGVGYRWFVRLHADRLGLRGWVRNEFDGSVVAEVRGTPAAVEEFAEVLRRGSPGARVAGVSVTPRSSQEALPDSFLIRR
jgi:acylphosphatase